MKQKKSQMASMDFMFSIILLFVLLNFLLFFYPDTTIRGDYEKNDLILYNFNNLEELGQEFILVKDSTVLESGLDFYYNKNNYNEQTHKEVYKEVLGSLLNYSLYYSEYNSDVCIFFTKRNDMTILKEFQTFGFTKKHGFPNEKVRCNPIDTCRLYSEALSIKKPVTYKGKAYNLNIIVCKDD